MYSTDTTSTAATIAAIHAAMDAGDVYEAYTGLAEAGLRPLWVKHGSKVPAEKPEVGVTDPRRGGGWHLAARDTTDAAAQVRAVRRRADQRGTPNLALVPDAVRVAMLDFDTTAETAVAREFWARVGGDPADIDKPTVSTPGQKGDDGEWQHRDGGHLWIALPDIDDDFTSLGSTIDVTGTGEAPVEIGRDESGRPIYAPSASLKIHSGYALVPPSTRPEGAYVRTGSVVPAPEGLIAWLRARVAGAERARIEGMKTRERRAAERAAAEARGEAAPLADADKWAASTPWSEILGDLYGWYHTGTASCGCEVWRRPGGSPRSAIAHDPGCSNPSYSMEHDHGPVYLFTDNPDAPLAEMRDHRMSQGAKGRTLTKLEAAAAIMYHEYPVETRVSRMLEARGWGTPACVTAFADLAGKGYTARAAQASVSALSTTQVAAPMEERVNEAPQPSATTQPYVTDGVTVAVTEGGTQPATEAGTQSATPRGTRRRRFREAPRPTAAPTDTPDVRALRDEFEDRLDRELTAEQVQHLADLLASNDSSAHTLEGAVRDAAWGGHAPAWSPDLVADLMSEFEFTRRIFWWAQAGERRVHPVTLTLLALQAMSRELPVALQAPSSMPGVGSPLSTYVVAVGASGSGKNVVQNSALDWARGAGFIRAEDVEGLHTPRDPASPLAMSEPLMRQVDVTSADDVAAAEDAAAEAGKKRGPKPVKWTMRPDPVGCYVIDELSALFERGRSAQALPQALCTAWSEANFLASSASNGNRAITGRYRVTLVGGLQPAQAAGLLETSGLGLIQRVIMAPVIWPGFGVLDERDVPRPSQQDQVAVAGAESRWPGIAAAISMSTVDPGGVGTQTSRGVVFPADEEVIKAMKAEAVSAGSPDAGADTDSTAAMMTHATQTTSRIATLVAIADGASRVMWRHWNWAWKIVHELHEATLAHAVAGAEAARVTEAQRLGRVDSARRSAAESETRSTADSARDAILSLVEEAGETGITAGELHRRLNAPLRPHRDSMIDALVAAGRIRADVVRGGRRLYPAAPSADGVVIPMATVRPAPGANKISFAGTEPEQR